MEKPWLSRYPEGVPAEIDLSGYNSILDIYQESLEKFRDRPAYMNFGKEITFNDWDRLSRDFGAYLQSLGLQKGDRIALMMPNIMQYPVAIMGALRAGLIVVNTNPMYTARELRHQLTDSGAKAIVVVENFADVLEKVRSDVPVEHVITTRVGDLLGFPKGALINFVLKHVKKAIPPFNLPGAVPFNDAVYEGGRHELARVEYELDDIAFLQYTGGTTGVAKGAMLTQKNLLSNAQALVECWRFTSQDVLLHALPIFHTHGLFVATNITLLAGGAVKVAAISSGEGGRALVNTMPTTISTLAQTPSRQPLSAISATK